MTAAPVVVHNPVAQRRPVGREPLAARLGDLQDAVVTVVRMMPPGSGVEFVAADLRALGESLGARCPDHLRRDFLIDDAEERQELAGCSDAVVLVAGPTATVTELSVQYASYLEKAGIPTAVVHAQSFEATVRHARSLAECPAPGHSVGPWGKDAPTERLHEVFGSLLSEPDPGLDGDSKALPSARFLEAPSAVEMVERLHEYGVTDGLPVVLPTPDAVDAMLEGTSWDRDRVVTETFQPEGRRVTVEDLAVIGVLAGAQPRQLPALMALAVLFGNAAVAPMTKSVNSFAFAQYFGGPLAADLGISGGVGALGAGHRANRVLARAQGLMARNFGGAYLGVNSTPAQGNPAGPGFAFTDAGAPAVAGGTGWSPLQRDFGFDDTESSLTLFAGGFMHFGNFYYGGLDELAAALSFPDLPTGALVLVTEPFAKKRAEEGYSRERYQSTLLKKAQRTMGELRRSGFYPLKVSMTKQGGFGAWPESYLELPDEAEVPIYGADGLHVAVVGSHALLAQIWIMGRLGSIGLDQFQ